MENSCALRENFIYFKANLRIIYIFKPTTGNLDLRKLSSDNAVKEQETLH